MNKMTQLTKLRMIKISHTIIWAVFAGSIIAIPILVWIEMWTIAGILILIVLSECLVLLFNGMRCPLTDIAARYTDDRTENFDIYLPLWLARHNKTIFGSLFLAGLIFTILIWLGSISA